MIMKDNKWGIFIIIFTLLIIISGCSGESSTQNASSNETSSTENRDSSPDTDKMKSNIIMGSSATGSFYHSISTGVANVLNNHAPFQVTLSTYAGPDAWIPLMEKDEVHIGIIPSTMAMWAFKGEDPFNKPYKNLRTIVRAEMIDPVPIIVREDSDIHTVKDLKGKRVASDYGAHKTINGVMSISLELAGLSWDDVIAVPVTSYQQGIDALRDNQVDAAWGGSPNAAATVEADAAIGVRTLHFGDIKPEDIPNVTAEQLQTVQSFIPGGRFATTQGGFVHRETTIIEYPDYFSTSIELSEDIVYEITKIIWENHEELHPIFPALSQWVPEHMFDPTPVIPYHDGAIKFFKENGIWTEEADEHHKALINQ